MHFTDQLQNLVLHLMLNLLPMMCTTILEYTVEGSHSEMEENANFLEVSVFILSQLFHIKMGLTILNP